MREVGINTSVPIPRERTILQESLVALVYGMWQKRIGLYVAKPGVIWAERLLNMHSEMWQLSITRRCNEKRFLQAVSDGYIVPINPYWLPILEDIVSEFDGMTDGLTERDKDEILYNVKHQHAAGRTTLAFPGALGTAGRIWNYQFTPEELLRKEISRFLPERTAVQATS